MGIVFNASKKRLNQEQTQEDILQEQKNKEEEEKKLKEVKIFHFPQSRIKQLEEMYSTVVVRDFGDDYHKDEEEKSEASELYEVYKPIQKHKTRYNNIVDFVKAMRECHNFIVAVANKSRLLMDPDEFIKGVYNGKIEVARLRFPVYKGRDRKDINWTNVSKYVLDQSLDPRDLSSKKEINYLPKEVSENPREHLRDYFSEEQIDFIFNSRDEDEGIIRRPYDEEFDDEPIGVALPATKKEMKKLMKRFPDLVRPLKDAKLHDDIEGSLRDFAFELNQEAYEYISKLDKKRGFLTEDRVPEFKGSVLSKKDVKRYLYELDEFEENHSRINYHGSYITISDYKDELMKEALTKAGWNVMKLYNNKKLIKKREKEDKADKKKEKRLRKELSKITSRREKRKEGSSMINTKKKKHKKKSKKIAKAFDNVITAGSGKDFDEYEAMMLDMSYNYKDED